MRVYLDACSLQRPFDNRSQPRINIEAEAVLTILRLVEAGQLELLSSEALLFEIERIPGQERKLHAERMLKLANPMIELNDEIEKLAEVYVRAGIKPMDALHLAAAVWSKADAFCTCDDKFLKKAQSLPGLATRVLSPLQLVMEVAS